MMYLASALKGLVSSPSGAAPRRVAGEFIAASSLTDDALVALAQSGERGAFDALVARYRRRLVKICRHYLKNEDDAEDAVQKTLLKAYRGLKYFRGDAAFYSWLHRIAINTAVTVLSLRKRDEALFLAGGIKEGVPEATSEPKFLETPEDIALANEIAEVVIRAIDSLCEMQRTAITLHELEGMNYAEVAHAMACPLGTVRSRVSRARDAIDAHLRKVYDRGLERTKNTSRRRLKGVKMWVGA